MDSDIYKDTSSDKESANWNDNTNSSTDELTDIFKVMVFDEEELYEEESYEEDQIEEDTLLYLRFLAKYDIKIEGMLT